MHIDFSMTTMGGFADMMTQLMTQLGGGAGGRQIVDMTGIKGNYDASLEISLAEIIAGGAAAGGDITGAPDPGGGGSSMADAVQSMGLMLESRKAMVDQFIVDYVEKMPSEN
jgi:uncharacterized protein (TIGR03435 family)